MTTAHATERPAALSDEELMRRIQADDVRAFEVLYDRYSASAFGLARAMCGSGQRAEEALQDGFLAVWRSRSSYDPARGSGRAWVLTVIRHRCIDLIRRGRQDDDLCESDRQLEYFPAPNSVAEDVEQHDQADRVRASLRELPSVQREVIALAYFAGLSHTEIAAGLQPGRHCQRADAARVEQGPDRNQPLQLTPIGVARPTRAELYLLS